MAYFQILYFVHDETNPWVVYKLNTAEAKEMVLCGRGKLRDNETMTKVNTPEEWLSVVDKNDINAVQSDDTVESIEELRKAYVEKFWKNLSIRYQNDVEWIKTKLYS